jgi:hypothetical protein
MGWLLMGWFPRRSTINAGHRRRPPIFVKHGRPFNQARIHVAKQTLHALLCVRAGIKKNGQSTAKAQSAQNKINMFFLCALCAFAVSTYFEVHND